MFQFRYETKLNIWHIKLDITVASRVVKRSWEIKKYQENLKFGVGTESIAQLPSQKLNFGSSSQKKYAEVDIKAW